MRFEFGTTIWVRSKVWICVARTAIFFTTPCWPPTSIQSPTAMGRSTSRMMPETKFDTTCCMPKPMPTDSAPATKASEVRSIPAEVMAKTAASARPT